MRTTLKRGRGRAAPGNGNGRAVLPPGTLAPMRRYQQPPPPPRRTATRIFGWILLVIVIVASGIGGGAYLYYHETLGAIAAHTPGVVASQKDLQAPKASAPAGAPVIGYEARAGASGYRGAGFG